MILLIHSLCKIKYKLFILQDSFYLNGGVVQHKTPVLDGAIGDEGHVEVVEA